MCLELQHVALGAVGGHLLPPCGMRDREDESAKTKKKKKKAAADVQIQAEMKSVYLLILAIPPVHYSRLF